MIASTGPRISQSRLVVIVAILLLIALILSAGIDRSVPAAGPVEDCRRIDEMFTGSHYVFDRQTMVCKPEGESNAD